MGTFGGRLYRREPSTSNHEFSLKPSRIYLDHAATTPVLPDAQAAMAEAMERWANPSSPHAEGRAAKAALERARADIADALGWRHELILTSGASEAIAMVAARVAVPGRITGAIEHDAVLHFMGKDATILPVDEKGLVDGMALGTALEGEPALVAIQQVNNETGVIQPVEAFRERVRETGGLFFADCAQGAGKVPLPDADFIAISAHKFGGPPGIGALLVRDLVTLGPSGGQEKGYRRGTQNLPAVVGMAAALRSGAHRKAQPRLARLRDKLEQAVIAAGGVVIAGEQERVANISALALPGMSRDALVVQLDLAGFAVSAGPACSSGSMKGSRVLAAMGVDPDIAGSAIRVSMGPQTTEAEIDAFVAAFARLAERSRSRAA